MLGSFNSYIVILDKNKEEHVIDVCIEYSAYYNPGKNYGPPEDCYQEESELELLAIIPSDPLPEGITQDMLYKLATHEQERIEIEAWHDFLTGDINEL